MIAVNSRGNGKSGIKDWKSCPSFDNLYDRQALFRMNNTITLI